MKEINYGIHNKTNECLERPSRIINISNVLDKKPFILDGDWV